LNDRKNEVGSSTCNICLPFGENLVKKIDLIDCDILKHSPFVWQGQAGIKQRKKLTV